MGLLGALCWQGGVVEGSRTLGIEREVEVVVPAELEACLAQSVVAELHAGMSLREIRRVRGDLVRDHALTDIFAIREPEVLLGA